MKEEEIKKIIENPKPHEEKEKKFSFVPVGKVIKNLKPIQWLIEDYIEQHTMSLIFGDPSSGKSFIAIDQACCIATGTPYHGQDIAQGAVFYIAGEGHNGLGRRFKAWSVQNRISLDGAPLYVADRPAQFFDAAHANEVGDAVQALADQHGQKPNMIIIDTLARNFGGGDENQTKDMNLFVKHIDELKDRWKASALIVHHTGHGDKGRARGAMALKGALDHEYRIEKNLSGITMINTKTKDSKEPPAMFFSLVSTPITLIDGSTVGSAALKKADINISPISNGLTKQQNKALKTLNDCLEEKGQKRKIGVSEDVLSITLQEYRDAIIQNKVVNSDKPDTIRRSLERIIKELNSLSITDTCEKYIWILDEPDKAGGSIG